VVILEGAMLGVLVRYLEKVKPDFLDSARTPVVAPDDPDEATW
jgi:hypothetical protein